MIRSTLAAFLRAFRAELARIREAVDTGTPPRIGWIDRAGDGLSRAGLSADDFAVGCDRAARGFPTAAEVARVWTPKRERPDP